MNTTENDVSEKGRTIPAMALRLGDRFVVEPGDGDDFVATLTGHHGWGLVHGCIDLAARRDGEGGEFLYSIHYETPVRLAAPIGGEPRG